MKEKMENSIVETHKSYHPLLQDVFSDIEGLNKAIENLSKYKTPINY